jgi:hypothetical protein
MAAHVFGGAGSALAGDEWQAISIKTAQAHASVATGAMCLPRFIIHATLTTPYYDTTTEPVAGTLLNSGLNLAHQVLATVLIVNLNMTSPRSGAGLHWTPILPSFCHMARPYVR